MIMTYHCCRCAFCNKKLSQKYFTREDQPACQKVKTLSNLRFHCYQIYQKLSKGNIYFGSFSTAILLKIIVHGKQASCKKIKYCLVNISWSFYPKITPFFLPRLSATRKQFTSVEFASSRSQTTTFRWNIFHPVTQCARLTRCTICTLHISGANWQCTSRWNIFHTPGALWQCTSRRNILNSQVHNVHIIHQVHTGNAHPSETYFTQCAHYTRRTLTMHVQVKHIE